MPEDLVTINNVITRHNYSSRLSDNLSEVSPALLTSLFLTRSDRVNRWIQCARSATTNRSEHFESISCLQDIIKSLAEAPCTIQIKWLNIHLSPLFSQTDREQFVGVSELEDKNLQIRILCKTIQADIIPLCQSIQVVII